MAIENAYEPSSHAPTLRARGDMSAALAEKNPEPRAGSFRYRRLRGRLRPGAPEPDSRGAVSHGMPCGTVTSATLGVVTWPRGPRARPGSLLRRQVADRRSAAVMPVLSSHLVQGAETRPV
jgi:hypothetical protein